jgi:hypothetical protein
MIKKRYVFLAALLITILWITSPDRAYSAQSLQQVLAPAAPLGSGFTYQGLLKASGGTPINSTCSFQFTLWYDLGPGGTQIGGTSTANGVSVTNGYFSALVNAGGEFGSLPFDNTTLRYLQTAVKCGSDPGYTTLSPRQAVTYTPPTHDHWGQTWTGSGTAIALQLSGGTGGLWASGPSYGVYGQSSSTDGRGLSGYATATEGQNFGLWARSDSTKGIGVYGNSSVTTGRTYGVVGESASYSGIGVYGYNSSHENVLNTFGVAGRAESGVGVLGVGQRGGVWGKALVGYEGVAGVFGDDEGTSGSTYGVWGRTSSPSGYGVFGQATYSTGTNYGVFGVSASTDGQGVHGYASAATGKNAGVYGESLSSTGRGVYGYAASSTGMSYGVIGKSNSTGGIGVYGHVDQNTGYTYGVYGISNSPSGYGVFGYGTGTTGNSIGVAGITNSSKGTAGLFYGLVWVWGNIWKSGGGFKIDHPLDPANQYLYHSFVESPDMLNIYNGTAALDENGQARVQLPDWFETLNQDFRYQLTCIGGFAPVYIARGVEDNGFLIAGGAPGIQVSWQVTGVRHDPWAEANRLQVEQPKPDSEIGTYMYPELYGQPPELGLMYQLVPPPPEPSPQPPQSPEPPALNFDLDSLLVPVLTSPPAPVPPQTVNPE